MPFSRLRCALLVLPACLALSRAGAEGADPNSAEAGSAQVFAAEAGKKYRMAKLAIEDRDFALAEKLFREAVKLAPENGELRYEFSLFLAGQGQGREALRNSEGVKGGEDLQARLDYLRLKIKIAEVLDGRFVEAVKESAEARKDPKRLLADGTLAVECGQVVWTQRFNGRPLAQRFSFPVHKLLSDQEEYDLELTWRTFEGEAPNYIPDRHLVKLHYHKTSKGWIPCLTAFDDKGNSLRVEFKADPRSEPTGKP